MVRKKRPVVSRKRLSGWVLAALAVAGWICAARVTAGQNDPARSLYQQAMHEEEALGNASSAIKLYERVIATSAERRLAANAELRLAELYRKLGRRADARVHHERIVTRYAQDTALANLEGRARRPGTGAASRAAGQRRPVNQGVEARRDASQVRAFS